MASQFLGTIQLNTFYFLNEFFCCSGTAQGSRFLPGCMRSAASARENARGCVVRRGNEVGPQGGWLMSIYLAMEQSHSWFQSFCHSPASCHVCITVVSWGGTVQSQAWKPAVTSWRISCIPWQPHPLCRAVSHCGSWRLWVHQAGDLCHICSLWHGAALAPQSLGQGGCPTWN